MHTPQRRFAQLWWAILGLAVATHATDLETGWAHPPRDARLRAYWWWLNGNVTRDAITRDLEAMRAAGFGGALICDADGSSQDGNERVPHGATFFSPAWRALYRHALAEADRLGLEMSLNIQSGWNLGGPMVSADDAPKKLVWTERVLSGPQSFAGPLERPKARDGYYRDLFVVAYRVVPPKGVGLEGAGDGVAGGATQKADARGERRLLNWRQKALHQALHFSAPDTTPLLVELPSAPGEEHTRAADVQDLTAHLEADGILRWEVPAGDWEVLRFGCTLNDHCRVSTCSEGWNGYALDPFDAGAFRRYWDAAVVPLLEDAGELAGRTLRYLHTDSWEVEVANWTPTLRAEFRQRRGYDLLPYLPALAGRIVDSRSVSHRFLHDLRRTFGDLAIANHYRLFREGAHAWGLRIHPESGGPHAVPIDAQQCLGYNDAPMSEFWAWSWRHRVGESNRFFVKQPASAAHTYGRKLVLAEGFTTIGPHWQETLWDNLKPAFDRACCEGLNLLVWHTFTCSPAGMGMPGQQYFAGTHLNANVTWWSRGGPFFAYLNRCQWMLQQGQFVADVAYYYGDHVPNFSQLKRSDPARVLPGFDYDVVTEEVILERMSVRDGRLVLPDGMSYRLLVLPDQPRLSLPVLRRLEELVTAGATVLGPRPLEATSLQDYPQCDVEVAERARRLWGEPAVDNVSSEGAARERAYGLGRVITGRTAREVLLADGVRPDFVATVHPCEADLATAGIELDYLHRRDGNTDLYFVANPSNRVVMASCRFRVEGKAPELWDPVTGERRWAAAYEAAEGGTMVPLEFAPFGSWFVVFRQPAQAHPATTRGNHPHFRTVLELGGPWTVHFPAGASAAEWRPELALESRSRAVEFPRLTSWTEHTDPGIKYYSGTATYVGAFTRPEAEAGAADARWYLDLGELRELAAIRLNGHDLGVVWAPPFRVALDPWLVAGTNHLAIDVVNFWPNRLIGDAALPLEQRRTRTNIRKLTPDTPLVTSGLLGPVRLQVQVAVPLN